MDYNDTRLLLNKMRKGGFRNEEKTLPKYNIRYFMGKMRKLNEEEDKNSERIDPKQKLRINKATPFDQQIEENKLKKVFDDMNVVADGFS